MNLPCQIMSCSFACTICKHRKICFRVLHFCQARDGRANQHKTWLLAGSKEWPNRLEQAQWADGVYVDKVLNFSWLDLGKIPVYRPIACVCYDHIQALDLMFRRSQILDGILGVRIRYSIDLDDDKFAILAARKSTEGLTCRMVREPDSSDKRSVGLTEETSSESSSETYVKN